MEAFLRQVVSSRLPALARSWLEQALAVARDPRQHERLLRLFAEAARKSGKQALALTDAEQRRLRETSPDPWPVMDHWGVDEAVRALLLVAAGNAYGGRPAYEQVVQACYTHGDAREQQSWLRGLSLLPGCDRFLPLAVDACRTNIVQLFEAIACENPYPARYFPQLNFNQMVLKCLFNGIALERVCGLETRLNEELSRMGESYARELEVAGRPVPPDVWLIVAATESPERLDHTLRYLEHDNVSHRYWAATGLGRGRARQVAERLRHRVAVESDERVRAAIRSSLGALEKMNAWKEGTEGEAV